MVLTRSSGGENHHHPDQHSRNQRKQGGGAARAIHHHHHQDGGDDQQERLSPEGEPPRAVPGQWCWHCCHELGEGDVPVHIPQRMVGSTYEVYGYFCSLPCAKAYILEHPTFDSRRQLLYLNKVGAEVYGVRPPIVQAPPRLCLKQFGGDLDLAEFRCGSLRTVRTCEVPPFSRILARYDERPVPGRRLNKVPDAIEMTRPPPVVRQSAEVTEEEEEEVATRRRPSGGLGRFMVS